MRAVLLWLHADWPWDPTTAVINCNFALGQSASCYHSLNLPIWNVLHMLGTSNMPQLTELVYRVDTYTAKIWNSMLSIICCWT